MQQKWKEAISQKCLHHNYKHLYGFKSEITLSKSVHLIIQTTTRVQSKKTNTATNDLSHSRILLLYLCDKCIAAISMLLKIAAPHMPLDCSTPTVIAFLSCRLPHHILHPMYYVTYCTFCLMCSFRHVCSGIFMQSALSALAYLLIFSWAHFCDDCQIFAFTRSFNLPMRCRVSHRL